MFERYSTVLAPSVQKTCTQKLLSGQGLKTEPHAFIGWGHSALVGLGRLGTDSLFPAMSSSNGSKCTMCLTSRYFGFLAP